MLFGYKSFLGTFEPLILIMEFNEEWEEFLLKASKHFKVMANYEFLLFVTGIQELGQGYKTYSKQEKMDLIALAQCKLLSMKGFMKEDGQDDEGWPKYIKLKNIEDLSPSQKENLVRKALIEYFEPIISN